jgi:hypothetical protein
MTKAEQFLWIVQTTALANGINLAGDPEYAEKYRQVISATGTLITADEAVRASELIPESMTAFEAAHQFCYFTLQNLRDIEEKADGKKMQVPDWFARS